MITTNTFARTGNRNGGGPHARRHSGVAILRAVVLGAVLISTTACGSNPASTTSMESSTSTSTTSATSTTTTTSTITAALATTSTPADLRPTETRDELVGVVGQRVHIRCAGSGSTTVVLIAGFEAGSEGWTTIEPALAERARVCSYDRPGTGTSDPPTSTQTFATQAATLHALLATAGEPGPYVVAGQSFGGAEAVTFASRFGDGVAGLVLVDASPVTWPAALCAVPDDGSAGAATVGSVCAGFSDPNSNHEHLDVIGAFAGAFTIVSLGSLPMTVITAVDRELPPIAATEVTRLTEAWNEGQQDWLALSTASRLVSVGNTGHHIEIDQPGVVVDEITRLLP